MIKLKEKSSALVKESNGVTLGFSKGANYEVTIYSDTKMSTAQLNEEEMLKLAFWINKKAKKNDLHSLIFDVDHLFDFIGACTENSKEVKRLQGICEDNADRMKIFTEMIEEQDAFIHAISVKLQSICDMVFNGAVLENGLFENLQRIANKAKRLSEKTEAQLD